MSEKTFERIISNTSIIISIFSLIHQSGFHLELEISDTNGNLSMYFEDQLNDRSQKVFIDENYSFQKPVSAGVPQKFVHHWCSPPHYAVTHVRNENSNNQGRSPNVVKVIFHIIRNCS